MASFPIPYLEFLDLQTAIPVKSEKKKKNLITMGKKTNFRLILQLKKIIRFEKNIAGTRPDERNNSRVRKLLLFS